MTPTNDMPINLIDASPALKEAEAKKVAIQLKLSELEKERETLRQQIDEDDGRNNKAARLMSEADMILSGSTHDTFRDHTPRLQELTGQIHTLMRALELQVRAVDETRAKEGARIGGKFKAAYHRRASRVVAALAELGKAQEDEYQYRRAVIDGDYPLHTLGTIFYVSHVGRIGDPYSHCNRIIDEARKEGLAA